MNLNEAIVKYNSKKVNLVFIHGIGDCMMFMPTITSLQKKYSDIYFNIITITKQVDLFKYFGFNSSEYKKISDENIHVYNDELYYTVIFNMSEGTSYTKNELCCLKEMGELNSFEQCWYKPTLNSKIIGIHFQNTCLPLGANPSYEQSKLIWNTIKDLGYIPLEIHFHHDFHNPINTQFDFIDFSTRKMECKIGNMINMIGSCRKFIGVNSGPFFVSLKILGVNNTLMLEKEYKIKHVVRQVCNTIDINKDIDLEILRNFITCTQ